MDSSQEEKAAAAIDLEFLQQDPSYLPYAVKLHKRETLLQQFLDSMPNVTITNSDLAKEQLATIIQETRKEKLKAEVITASLDEKTALGKFFGAGNFFKNKYIKLCKACQQAQCLSEK